MIDSYIGSNEKIVITAPAPKLICSICGKEFTSRGKRDNDAIDGIAKAICTDCENVMDAPLIGGPIGVVR